MPLHTYGQDLLLDSDEEKICPVIKKSMYHRSMPQKATNNCKIQSDPDCKLHSAFEFHTVSS